MLFSEKLRMLRKESKFTQEQLAEKLNVSRQAVTKWESGNGIPDIESLKAISILFKITIDELVNEDKTFGVKGNKQYNYTCELEIDHTKHFDIHICKIEELNIIPNIEEKVKIELLSSKEENLKDIFKIKFDNLYNKLDIDVKSKKIAEDVTMNLYLPEKYINDIELNSKMKTLNICNLTLKCLEYDGVLKYLNTKNLKGKIVLNTLKCDIEACYDIFEGMLEVNTINSTARVQVPKGTKYKAILKGIKNEFVDAVNVEDSKNIIELNGVGSRLIVIEK